MREVHISIGKYVGVLEGQLLRWDESNCVARPAGEKHQKWWSQGKILSNTFLDVDMLQMNGTYRVLLLVADMLPISFLQRRTRLPSICLRTLLTASVIRIVCPSSSRTLCLLTFRPSGEEPVAGRCGVSHHEPRHLHAGCILILWDLTWKDSATYAVASRELQATSRANLDRKHHKHWKQSN